jgi:hypothetical protein
VAPTFRQGNLSGGTGHLTVRDAAGGLVLRHLAAFVLIAIAPIVLIGAQRDRVIGRLAPISDFPKLPAGIAQDLMNRGCRIPQVKGVREQRNVIQGQFKKTGQRDWAALCLQGNTSTILVYWNGSAESPAQLAPMDETITPSKNGYYRILQVVSKKFIRNHYEPSASDMDPLPGILDHDGIDDGIFEKGSIVHYFDNGKWLKLAGSD